MGKKYTLPKVDKTYLFSLFLTSILMLLLPAIYIGLVVCIAYFTVDHVWHRWWLVLSLKPTVLGLFIWIGPSVAGAIVTFFMFKPILARPVRTSVAVTLDSRRHRSFFEVLENLCKALRSPMPRTVRLSYEVNASASFRRPWIGLFSSDLVLTIGTPLMTGLTPNQLLGVIAHEFAHFSQRAGMRLSLVINLVNHWFGRVVYERDKWDEDLDDRLESTTGWAVLALRLAQGGVWLSRKVLTLLMHVGHAASAHLSRQMEYDADLCAATIIGCEDYVSALKHLTTLSEADRELSTLVYQIRQEGHLPRRLSRYVSLLVTSY